MSERSQSEQDDLVRDLYRTLYEEKSFDAVSEFYTPGAVRHGGLKGTIEGREELQAYLQGSLGVLLASAGSGYVVDSFGRVLFAGYSFDVAAFTFVGEVLLIIWLLIYGRQVSLDDEAASVAN